MTDTPIKFHRLNTAEMNGTYVKGHVYFNSATGTIYLAKGTAPGDLEPFSSDVKSVTYDPLAKKLTITKKAGGASARGKALPFLLSNRFTRIVRMLPGPAELRQGEDAVHVLVRDDKVKHIEVSRHARG